MTALAVLAIVTPIVVAARDCAAGLWPDVLRRSLTMKKLELSKTREFDPRTMKKFLLHDSPWFKIINFNLPAGHVFPVHSHDTEGQLSILVIEGDGEFLAA